MTVKRPTPVSRLSVVLALLLCLTTYAMFKDQIVDLYRRFEGKYYTAAAYFSIANNVDIFTTTEPPTLSSFKILRGLGVNVHMQYHDTPYNDGARVVDLLRYIKVSQVRDIAPSTPGEQGIYAALAASGIRFDLFDQGAPDSARLMTALAAAHPGSIVALEGPNEIDNFPVRAGHDTGRAAADQIQQGLRRLARGPGALRDAKLYMYTGFSPDRPDVLGNIHFYPRRGQDPTAQLLGAIWATNRGDGSRPFVITETGYFTGAPADGWGGVSEAGQARGLVEDLLDAFRLGADGVFIYELIDEAADTGPMDQEHHFGLYDLACRPKAAAHALHNLMSLLQTPVRGAAPAPAPSLDPSAAHALVIRDTPTAYSLVVWRPSPRTARPAALRVDLKRAVPSAEVILPLVSTEPRRRYHDVRFVTLDPTAGPVVLRVTG
jgi:hypothetical protein